MEQLSRAVQTLIQLTDFVLKAAGAYVSTEQGQREWEDVLQAWGLLEPDAPPTDEDDGLTDEEIIARMYAGTPDGEGLETGVYNRRGERIR